MAIAMENCAKLISCPVPDDLDPRFFPAPLVLVPCKRCCALMGPNEKTVHWADTKPISQRFLMKYPAFSHAKTKPMQPLHGPRQHTRALHGILSGLPCYL